MSNIVPQTNDPNRPGQPRRRHPVACLNRDRFTLEVPRYDIDRYDLRLCGHGHSNRIGLVYARESWL